MKTFKHRRHSNGQRMILTTIRLRYVTSLPHVAACTGSFPPVMPQLIAKEWSQVRCFPLLAARRAGTFTPTGHQ